MSNIRALFQPSSSEDSDNDQPLETEPEKMPVDKFLTHQQLSIFLRCTSQEDFFLKIRNPDELQKWLRKFNLITNKNSGLIPSDDIAPLYIQSVVQILLDQNTLTEKQPFSVQPIHEILQEVYYRKHPVYQDLISEYSLDNLKEVLEDKLAEVKHLSNGRKKHRPPPSKQVLVLVDEEPPVLPQKREPEINPFLQKSTYKTKFLQSATSSQEAGSPGLPKRIQPDALAFLYAHGLKPLLNSQFARDLPKFTVILSLEIVAQPTSLSNLCRANSRLEQFREVTLGHNQAILGVREGTTDFLETLRTFAEVIVYTSIEHPAGVIQLIDPDSRCITDTVINRAPPRSLTEVQTCLYESLSEASLLILDSPESVWDDTTYLVPVPSFSLVTDVESSLQRLTATLLRAYKQYLSTEGNCTAIQCVRPLNI